MGYAKVLKKKVVWHFLRAQIKPVWLEDEAEDEKC